MMALKEYASAHGISADTVRRRIKSGRLRQIKKDGKYFIFEENEVNPGGQVMDREKLRDDKLIAEIKLLRQKDKENEASIRADERSRCKEELIEYLKPLPDAYRLAKLTEEQSKIITEGHEKAMANVAGMKR